MLAADEALVVNAGGPTLVRPGLSADVYSGKAVMMKLVGPFFARAGRGFVSSHIKFNIAMSRPIWQEVAGHSGLAECCFEIPWKGHSGSR